MTTIIVDTIETRECTMYMQLDKHIFTPAVLVVIWRFLLKRSAGTDDKFLRVGTPPPPPPSPPQKKKMCMHKSQVLVGMYS